MTLGSHTVLRLYSPIEEDGVALPWNQREVAAVLVGLLLLHTYLLFYKD